MNMRNATCVGTQTSKVPTQVAFLFISTLWLKEKDTGHPPSWIFKKSMTSQQGKLLFLKKQLAIMFDVCTRAVYLWFNLSPIKFTIYIYTLIAKCSRKFRRHLTN